MKIVIILSILEIFVYLINLGANKDKTKEEKQTEDEEQLKYIRNYYKVSEA